MVKGASNLTQPVALTIAGFDPSSGAGVTADLKVFAAHRSYGIAAITALTVQSTQGVRRVEPVSPETLRETLDCLAEDIEISGVKIGMLATEALVGVVGTFVSRFSRFDTGTVPIVLDPVLRSSSGSKLLTAEGLTALKAELLPLVGWITPNIDELSLLTDMPVGNREAVPEAAAQLASRYPNLNIVVTGGHLDRPDDFLRTADGVTQWFGGRRIQTAATHGSGCAFSSALLARLIGGDDAAQAVSAAKAYVAEAMRAARPLGHGHGPLNHLYRWD